MAKLEIQGIEVKCETSNYLTEYRIEMHFVTPETNGGMLNSIDFRVESDSRSDLPFDRVENLINEKVGEMDLEIIEISSIYVKEVNKIKKTVYQDGENYR